MTTELYVVAGFLVGFLLRGWLIKFGLTETGKRLFGSLRRLLPSPLAKLQKENDALKEDNKTLRDERDRLLKDIDALSKKVGAKIGADDPEVKRWVARIEYLRRMVWAKGNTCPSERGLLLDYIVQTSRVPDSVMVEEMRVLLTPPGLLAGLLARGKKRMGISDTKDMFRDRDEAEVFLKKILSIASCDGPITDSERAMIDKIATAWDIKQQ